MYWRHVILNPRYKFESNIVENNVYCTVKFKKKRERGVESERNIIIIILVEFLDALLRWATLFLVRIPLRTSGRVVVERVGILIAINFYLHSNFSVQMVQLGDRVSAIEPTNSNS